MTIWTNGAAKVSPIQASCQLTSVCCAWRILAGPRCPGGVTDALYNPRVGEFYTAGGPRGRLGVDGAWGRGRRVAWHGIMASWHHGLAP